MCWITRFRQRGQRLFLVLIWLVMVFMLVGCDDFFDVTVENHTDEAVTVQIGHTVFYQLDPQPCSVWFQRDLAITPYKRAVVRAFDQNGQKVGDIQVHQERMRSLGLEMVDIRIGGNAQGMCPAPIRGEYVVEIVNYAKVPATVLLDEVDRGTIEPRGTGILGPLDGTWEDALRIQFVDPDGQPLEGGIVEGQYPLGEVPHYNIGIRPSHD